MMMLYTNINLSDDFIYEWMGKFRREKNHRFIECLGGEEKR